MPRYAIEYQLSFMDLWTLLFQKKACPQCGAKLVRRTARQSTGPKWQWEGGWSGFAVGTRTESSAADL